MCLLFNTYKSEECIAQKINYENCAGQCFKSYFSFAEREGKQSGG